jgi:Arc/MetJ-type ribon-helix-helix transcriptional regulator
MTISISFPESTERQLRDRAAQHGQDVSEYVRSLVEKDLGIANGSAADKTLAEILTPVWQGFAESGMTEEEVTRLFEEAREEVWRERRKGTASP